VGIANRDPASLVWVAAPWLGPDALRLASARYHDSADSAPMALVTVQPSPGRTAANNQVQVGLDPVAWL